MHYFPNGQPKHARPVRADVQNDAACNAENGTGGHVYCPRHNAEAYADHMARHATDSIGPLMTVEESARAERFHSSNAWGR